jgi:Protein of unknown function (DUF3631)/Primase C terminal 2 (PriCT-2)/RepB DNA-primase from phage plasmid
MNASQHSPHSNLDAQQPERFLKLLNSNASGFTFQTFDDDRERKNPALTRIIQSPPSDRDELLILNGQGAGVFVTVNETDGRGRKSENIKRICAVFQEDDGGFDGLYPLQPSMVIETSPGHYHRYWLVADDWPADEQGRVDFAAVMERMVESYGSDKNAKDICRVLRVPGFLHRKGKPHLVRIIESNGRRYSRAEIVAAFPPVERPKTTKTQHEWAPRDNDDQRIRNALQSIDPNDREAWLQCGMALKHEMQEAGRPLWDDWSRQSSKYNERDQDRTWRSLKRDGVTIATVFHLAKQTGWTDERINHGPSTGVDTGSLDAINVDAESEIQHLASLPLFQYERERTDAAKRLGMRAAVLDKVVNAERPADTKGQGRAFEPQSIELWPSAVNGAELLDEISKTIARYVVLPPGVSDTLAIWALHTHCFNFFEHSPRAAITSPEKGCGKTTTLDVLGCLVANPLPTTNTSVAVIFRVVELHKPTLLIDEADTFLKENDELRGILNSGHRRGGSVTRTVGEDHEPRQFSTWAPAAIAMIGRLPDTLNDRSVVISLRRRKPTEKVESFRSSRTEDLHILARKMARWARDHEVRLGDSDPDMGTLFNRVADNWRPLFAIADEARADWPARVRSIAAAVDAATTEESINALLLTDIRWIFDGSPEGDDVPMQPVAPIDRMASSDIVDRLIRIEGRPWAEWKNGRQLTQNGLARLLRHFEISPSTIRLESGGTAKGYYRSAFDDAFDRYLSPQTVTPSQPNNDGHCDVSQAVTPNADVTLSKASQPNNDGHCDGVTVSNPRAAIDL